MFQMSFCDFPDELRSSFTLLAFGCRRGGSCFALRVAAEEPLAPVACECIESIYSSLIYTSREGPLVSSRASFVDTCVCGVVTVGVKAIYCALNGLPGGTLAKVIALNYGTWITTYLFFLLAICSWCRESRICCGIGLLSFVMRSLSREVVSSDP